MWNLTADELAQSLRAKKLERERIAGQRDPFFCPNPSWGEMAEYIREDYRRVAQDALDALAGR